MKRDAAGNLTPFAAGLRSPAGIGINARDELFITDNQANGWRPPTSPKSKRAIFLGIQPHYKTVRNSFSRTDF